jgi:hypothetical protein
LRLSSDVTFMKSVAAPLIFCALLLLSGSLSAENITGMVNNGTTGKPAAGDEVVLLRPGPGMEEVSRTQTNASGHFRFRLPGAGPHLIRAVHQGVSYDREALTGTTSVEVQVFDVLRKVAGLSVTADVMRFQAQGNELRGIRLFAVNNASAPPRTQLRGTDFEFFLPEGAEIDQGIAMIAGRGPVDAAPVREKDKNCYGFVFPLRPGETEFQVVFHMPYSGELSIDPKTLYSVQHFVVMVPKSMRFASAPGVTFQAMEDPRQSDALVRVVSNTRVAQPLNFTISGTGTLNDPGDDSQGAPHPVEDQAAAPSARDSSSAGGPGTGGYAPRQRLKRYRWYILGGFGLLLGAGAGYFAKRFRPGTVAHPGDHGRREPARPSAAPIPPGHSDLLLEQVKNELFQLEVEHQQGHISQPEYKRARAALDQTLGRVIKRTSRG